MALQAGHMDRPADRSGQDLTGLTNFRHQQCLWPHVNQRHSSPSRESLDVPVCKARPAKLHTSRAVLRNLSHQALRLTLAGRKYEQLASGYINMLKCVMSSCFGYFDFVRHKGVAWLPILHQR